ncbi:calcyclin-binding protein isoform 3 [Mus musculus]|uniref:calcyclin-binding protein isoform 3 n=1 Tax=Mus musculus TaxID=10090 RepID=UPI0023FEA321|nr:calcyclin-binding protein isoform 3 [Mus musculus]
MASVLEELQKDLEEVKVLLEKSTRKRLRDTLTSEKSKIETELKNKMQQKSQKKPELDNEKPAAVVAPLTTGYTVKISNYGWDQSDKFVKIYITLTGVHQVPTENVQVHFTERKPSYDTEADPSEGLMNVLKKIYEDGDDDMKRTINKAWVESREKQAREDTEF